jgi:hypothetical protein
MYDTKQKALDYFTMYPLGFRENEEVFTKLSDWDSPSEWYLNLNGTWQFRYDKAPRNRVWPRSTGPDVTNWRDTANNSVNWQALAGGINNVFGQGANAVRNDTFPAGVFGFNTTETYNQYNDDLPGFGTSDANRGVFLPAQWDTMRRVKDGWDDIRVPGSWQVNWRDEPLLSYNRWQDSIFKYDRLLYKNHEQPYSALFLGYTRLQDQGFSQTADPPRQAQNAWQTMPEVSNGVGTYQRDFTVPASWANKRVFLNFDGADSFYVWVNGVPVGYSEDKFTAAEFDITEALMRRG